jgi:hypothetical protein
VIGVVLGAAPLYLAAAGLMVLGEGREGCPRADAVSTRLDQLLGDEAGGEAPDALIVDGEPGALRVRLLSAQGSLREQKTLDLRGSCEELADAVATVAVAWRSRLGSDEVPAPVLAARVRQVYDAPPETVAEPAPARSDFELAYGVQTVTGPQRWAPGLVLGAQAPLSGGYGLAFTLQVPAPRRGQDPGMGKSWRWVELGLVIGPSHRSITENLFVDAQAGLGTGVNITTSESLSAPDSYRLVSPSLVGGLRWTYRHSSARPWFGLSFAAHLPGEQESPIKNAQLTSERWCLGLAVGGTIAFDQSP